MREKYESLALADLRAIAKARGLKGTSGMKKADLVEVMLNEDESEKNAGRADIGPIISADENTVPQERKETALPGERQGNTVRKNDSAPGERTRSPKRRETASGSENNKGVQRREYTQANEGGKSAEHKDNTLEGDSGRNTERREIAAGGEHNRSTERRETAAGGEHNRNTERRDGAQGSEYPRSQEKRETAGGDGVRSEDEKFPSELDSGVSANGILEVMPDGYGFIRCANYLPGENDVYVAPSQIRRFGLKTGDIVEGNTRVKTQSEKFSALLYVKKINGFSPDVAMRRTNFEDMTPIFPNERIRLETPGAPVAMRIMDLMSPVGKGQRGMIVSPPKAGKTTLLKEVAKSISHNNPNLHLIILLIDERPEEVTDIKEAIEGPNVEVIYSTFDELPDHHKRVSEMVIERAKRLVEHKKEVVILLDSITRLTRAYNLTVPPSGRTLSGGLDPAALHMPKRFFGAARNMREGGSLTILATALVETGSKMDDVVYEEFKGTGNMEMVLDRKLSEKRVFPAIDIPKSGTRRDDLLLNPEEMEAMSIMRKALNGMKADESVDRILDMFAKTKNNNEFVNYVKKIKFL